MAKAIVERAAQRTLAAEGLQDAPRFSVPIPFNTLLWRVVVMTPDEFLEGERSSSPPGDKALRNPNHPSVRLAG
jgi:inner membrane protein